LNRSDLRSDNVFWQRLNGQTAEHLTAHNFVVGRLHQCTQSVDGCRQLVLSQYVAATRVNLFSK